MDRRKIDINFNGVRHGGMEEKLYRAHLRTLANPPKKVDNSAPTLAVACYYNSARVASERFRLVNIELENRMLLQLINEIYRTKGKIDSRPPAMSWSTNYYERVYKNKKLEKSNRKLYEILKHAKPTLSKAFLDREYKRALEKMMFQARYTDYYSSLVPDLERWDICPNNMTDRRFCNVQKRVQCYMDIAIDDPRTSPDKLIKLGRLYMEIYRDYAPVTADNFLQFIKGYEGKSYKGTQFFRIQKCIGCVGGDIECNDGGGYYGIGSKCFPDENHLLQFNGPGVISTFTLFPGHNHSHFFISFRKLEPLNGKFVVFGRVIKTTSVLERIEECGTISGTPIQRVVVADCGFLENSGSDRGSFLKAKTSAEKKTSQASGVLVRETVRPEEPLKSSLVSSSQKISINTGGTSNTGVSINLDVEQAVSNLHQPTGPFALGNSGFLSQECTLERQALYSHLVRSYKWTDKIHEYSSLAAQLLGQNQLKRSYIVAGSNKRRRIQTSCHNVPIQTVDQVISAIDRQYPDMNLTVSRPFITNAVLQITLGKVLQAVIAFKGLLIEWVVIKGHGETLDLWTESRHKVFRKITENSHAAMLHFSSPAMPELAVRSFMTWLHSYISLFSEPCKRCGNHLHCALPPTWRDFRTLEAHHEECKV